MTIRPAYFLLPLILSLPLQLAAQDAPSPRAKVIEDAPPKPVKKARALPEGEAVVSAAELAAIQADELQLKDKAVTLCVQIFLDNAGFGPGKLDGAMGEFTRKAAAVCNEISKQPLKSWKKILADSATEIPQIYTEYELKENDFRFLVPNLPDTPAEMKDFNYLGYRSIEEFVAERYHTSEDFLAQINPNVRFSRAKTGDKIKVPNIKRPFVIEDVPYSTSYPADPALSDRRVLLDTKERMAFFYDEKGDLFASFPITPGKEKFIKPGEFELTKMVTTPEFRYDKSMLEKGQRSEDYYQLPPGPNSLVGIFWASTSRNGIGLHGTATPHAIGRGQSSGCVRFANWDAVRLPELIRPGTKLVMR